MIHVVGKKWAVCVISLLGKYGTVRFGPIQKCLSGVSPATLTSTLRALERARLVRRVPVDGPRGPVRVYALTGTGRSLQESLAPLRRLAPLGLIPGNGAVERTGGRRAVPANRQIGARLRALGC